MANLFLAGRCASFTHVAFASCRVQHALGQHVHFLRAQGTDPEADPDGDGQSNRCEFVVGSDPNVVNHPFVIDDLAPSDTGSLSLAWKGVAGRVYRVKHADSTGGPYENYGDPVVADVEGNCSAEIQTGAAAGFFKVEVSVP